MQNESLLIRQQATGLTSELERHTLWAVIQAAQHSTMLLAPPTAANVAERCSHDEFDGVALDGGGHGERDARVAAGGLDQRVPGLEGALPLCLADHAERRPEQ